MEKKIGIVTFHKAHNYGAVLQAYALKKIVSNMGGIVKFYNYNPQWLKEKYCKYPTYNDKGIYKIKRYIGYALDYKRRNKRYKGFDLFIENYLYDWDSSEVCSLTHIIVGSDQIWNPKITGGVDDICYGILPESNNAYCFSYAASAESLNLSPIEETSILKKIRTLRNVGVRESSLATWVNKRAQSTIATQNLDPTLLLTPSEWREIAKEKNINEPYLLVYENYKDENTIRIANDIAHKLNLKVITITTSSSWRYGENTLSDTSPDEFIDLFSKASFVLTTSYHGCAFSIIFGVQFVALKVKNGVNNRTESLFNLLGIENNLVVSSEFNYDQYREINYQALNEKLKMRRAESLSFLRKTIND
ncbi:polysaccharide pyruvyl transferase family protein [Pectobacterium carotovorum]|uniref:polysaccharide pyruvyl transferase family protein n=1 Tax=Pectobacterium carotovorum TaxID=554 RepID=UPI0032EE8FA2